MTQGSSATDAVVNGIIFVVSAPSGSGKTSVLQEILKIHPEIELSVSVTTRKPRGTEQNGVDYYFVSDEEFDDHIKKGDFIEWAEVHGKRYGTLKSTVQRAIENGRSIITDIDTVGAFNIKKIFPDAVLIFIAPPSPEVLNQRLKKRDTESSEFLKKRLDAVPQEMMRMKEYDYIVLNNVLEVAVSQVNSIIKAESLRSRNVLPTLSKWRYYLDKQ